eukprot:4472415-Pyramimonas_sp.AAC.1
MSRAPKAAMFALGSACSPTLPRHVFLDVSCERNSLRNLFWMEWWRYAQRQATAPAVVCNKIIMTLLA